VSPVEPPSQSEQPPSLSIGDGFAYLFDRLNQMGTREVGTELTRDSAAVLSD
jgi:hypothetical protein